jgi:methyltransferase (TIGR00027 family)
MPSRTALLTAAARGLHREEPPPWVLDDWLAVRLGGDEAERMRELLRQQLTPAALLAFSRWVCVRGRVSEDIVERAAAAGVRQHVTLGAGLDSFAYRHPDLRERMCVFEVDHPASQEWKRRRLRELGIDPPANFVYAPVDFERQALRDALIAAGFDFAVQTVWSWIGVAMFLTPAAIRSTLGTIAECPPGTLLVLTYNLPRDALTGLALTMATATRAAVKELGEPMISLFAPADIEQLLRELGYDEITHFGPEEARDTYFADCDDVTLGGAERIVMATVAA